jgi:hypothetical protein
MPKILDRLGFDRISTEDRPYIAEDFVFQASDYVSGRELRSVHEDVALEETPLAFCRQVHLQHEAQSHTALKLRFALCWNGFRDALGLLANYSQSFQRAIPEAAVANAAEKHGTGDFGLAWAWSGEGEPDILAFVKNAGLEIKLPFAFADAPLKRPRDEGAQFHSQCEARLRLNNHQCRSPVEQLRP